MNYTIAIDLDGTLTNSGYSEEIGQVRPEAKEVLDELKKHGVTIIVNTVRGDVDKIRDWLERNDLPYDYINYNPNQPEGSNLRIK